jgi:glycosyltransferase involved in cell wall biosynthesis
MKVLVVSHSYIADENQKNITALSEYADVRVVIPDHVHDANLGQLRGRLGNDTYIIGRRFSLPRSQYLLAPVDLGMKSFRPQIVHVEYDPWSVIFMQAEAARRRYAPDAKLVCTIKKNTFRPLPAPLLAAKKSVASRLIRNISQFLAVNERVKAIYAREFGVEDQRFAVVQHLGVDPEVFYPNDQPSRDGDVVTIGYCGRLDPHKGVQDLIAACADLHSAHPGTFRLRLLGNGSLRDSLREGSPSWLEVLNPVPHAEVADFMRGLDVFVLPSRITPDHEEHDAHVLLESLSCGVASVGTTSGIIPEVLGGGCGMIVPAGDVQALRAALEEIMINRDLRQSLAHRGHDKAMREFTIRSIADKKAQIYRQVLS